MLIRIWKPSGARGVIGVRCELFWDVSEGMGNAGALVLRLVCGLPALPRYKISLFFELQHLLEGALEIQFPWGREYLSCHNVKFSSPPIPSLVWCLHISFPRVLAWSQLPKGQIGRQDFYSCLWQNILVTSGKQICVQDWNNLLYNAGSHSLFQSSMGKFVWFRFIRFRPDLNLLRLVRGIWGWDLSSVCSVRFWDSSGKAVQTE